MSFFGALQVTMQKEERVFLSPEQRRAQKFYDLFTEYFSHATQKDGTGGLIKAVSEEDDDYGWFPGPDGDTLVVNWFQEEQVLRIQRIPKDQDAPRKTICIPAGNRSDLIDPQMSLTIHYDTHDDWTSETRAFNAAKKLRDFLIPQDAKGWIELPEGDLAVDLDPGAAEVATDAFLLFYQLESQGKVKRASYVPTLAEGIEYTSMDETLSLTATITGKSGFEIDTMLLHFGKEFLGFASAFGMVYVEDELGESTPVFDKEAFEPARDLLERIEGSFS